MHAKIQSGDGPERWHGGLLPPRSGDRVWLLPGQQRVRGSFWAISVAERAFGSGMSEQRGAVVVCMLIFGEGWDMES
jgi:hypothetical protein